MGVCGGNENNGRRRTQKGKNEKKNNKGSGDIKSSFTHDTESIIYPPNIENKLNEEMLKKKGELEHQIDQLINTKNKLVEDINIKEKEKEKEENNLEKAINSIKTKRQEKEYEENNLEKAINSIKTKRQEKENEENNLEKAINSIKTKRQEKEKEENNLKDAIKTIKKKREEKEKEEKTIEEEIKKKMEEKYKNLKKKINPELIEDLDPKIKQSKIIEYNIQNNDNSENFYDMVLNFSSFEQLKEKGEKDKLGWYPEFFGEGKKRYEECISVDTVTIGIVGNKNRGKSFLLGRIIGKPLRAGFFVNTIGISALFPNIEKKAFITLDTAGKDNPLLEQNVFNNIKENEQIRRMARDQKVSEYVLSDFIIEQSDVIIAVLEQLSFIEQDMLKNLIYQLKEKNIKGIRKKKLIVIHNLMNITEIEGIEKFKNDILLKSLTFSLKPQKMKQFKNNYGDEKRTIFIQKFQSEEKYEIAHLIMGHDSIKGIRENYNDPAIRYIRTEIKLAKFKKFNLIESFKNFVINNSKNYISGEPFNDKSLYIDKNYSIRSSNPEKEIELRGVFVDAKGIHNFFSTIEPYYSAEIIGENDKFYIEVEFEMYGNLKDIKSKVNRQNNQYFITIQGNVEQLDEYKADKYYGNLEYKEFYFQVIFEQSFPFKNEKNEIESAKEYIIININNIIEKGKDQLNGINGIYTIKYPIDVGINEIL